MTKIVSVEEAFGAGSVFTPADRTSKKKRKSYYDPSDSSAKPSKTVRGELPKDQRIFAAIKSAAEEFGVPLEYGLALAQQESSYDPNAHNDEFDADGLFQYIPETAKARGLKHGVDTRDPDKVARVAMQDFAEQMNKAGVDWAIKHHFAGPNTEGHGPKTAQYLADVRKRAEDIRAQLGGDNPAAVAGVGGGSDAGPKQQVGNGPRVVSLEEAFGSQEMTVPNQDDSNIELAPGVSDFIADQFGPTEEYPNGSIVPRFFREPVGDAVGSAFEHVKNRVLTDFGVYDESHPNYRPTKAAADPFADSRAIQARKDAPTPEAVDKDAPWLDRFLNAVGNPIEAMTSESLPANLLEGMAGANDAQRAAFLNARKILMQQHIVDNPGKFPTVSVEAAQAAIDERKAKQEPTVRKMWDQLVQAAKEDPATFGGQLTRAIVADPELLATPLGLGTKVIRGTRAGLTGRQFAGTANKVAKIADRIIDAGSTGAAMNLAIEAASAGADTTRELTSEEAAFAALAGGGLSGPFGIFFRGSRARSKLKSGDLTLDDLENALRDTAREEILAEEIATAPHSDVIYDMDGRPIPADARQRIEVTLGISKLSPEQRKAWHTARQKELAKTFKENWDEADYLKFKAEERMLRTQQLAEDAEGRIAADRAAAEQERAAVELYARDNRAHWQSEYDKALAARDQAEAAGMEDVAAREDQLRTAAAKLDEEEIIEAAFRDTNAVRNAMLRAAQRDQGLRVPKWQKGEIDPKTLARLGIGSLFAGTAFAVADPENKTEAALAAGLAGLVIPGGGRVLSKMRQAGMVSMDGDLMGINRLVAEGKLKADVDPASVKTREAEVVQRAKQGDTQAFEEIFKEHYPRVVRQINKKTRGIAARTGVDAEEIAQEVFIDLYKSIDKLPDDVNLGAWIYTIAQRKAVDSIRSAQTLKGGADVQTTSMYAPSTDQGPGSLAAGHILDEESGAIKGSVEAAAADVSSPEAEAIRQQSESVLIDAIKDLSDRDRLVFLLSKVEQHTAPEIAQMMGESLANVEKILTRTQSKVLEAVERGFKAKKVSVDSSEPVVKRGRGRPRKQVGEIDPRLLKVGGLATLGAGVGAYLNEENKLLGAGIGALAPVLLASRGNKGRTMGKVIVDQLDEKLGVISTRIMNKSVELWRRAIEHERIVLRDTHKHLQAVDPFLVRLQRLPANTRDILSRAILTGKPEVTNRLLNQLGDQELIASWKRVRSTLDSLGDQLVALKRFSKRDLDYFPRVVKDVDGLLKALGKERGSFLEEAIKKADEKSIRARGTGLTDLEKSMVINKVLREDRWASQQPGFAKNRGVEEITPELQKYYATPTESLHSYIRSAVEDIERAKFFGRDLQVIVKDKQEYTNIGESIGTLTNRLMNEGKLSPKDAEEVAGILRSRFMNGERNPGEIIQGVKNLSYAGLLGNPFSAAVQLGDVVIQAYTQDIRSTLEAVVRKLTGQKIVSMKDFGLVDHIAEEFVSTSKSAKFLKAAMKFGLFRAVDEFGKDIALNAAVIRFGRLAKTEGGIMKIAQKYERALGPAEFKQLITDLQKGERSDLVNSIAFAELSRTQPITRLELPQAYLDHPDGRLLYQFKSFMIKQIDVARRDAYNEIKAGHVAKGLKNLVTLGITMGVAGTATQKIKDFLLGRDVEWKATDVPMNMLKTYGLSEYFIDHFFGVSKEEAKDRREAGDKGARKIDAAPSETTLKMFVPPYKMFDEIVRGDPKAVRYIPIVGPYLYERQKEEKARSKN